MMNNNKSIALSTATYLILILLSVLTYQIAETIEKQTIVSIGVLAVAIIKVFMISDYFMKLNQVNGFWRWVILIWLIVLATGLSIAFTP